MLRSAMAATRVIVHVASEVVAVAVAIEAPAIVIEIEFKLCTPFN